MGHGPYCAGHRAQGRIFKAKGERIKAKVKPSAFAEGCNPGVLVYNRLYTVENLFNTRHTELSLSLSA